MWRRFVSRRHSRRFSPRPTKRVESGLFRRLCWRSCALFRVVKGRNFSSEITMGWTGTCHPEWGYLAAARRPTWKMRLFILVAAICASATGAACCSLLYRAVVAEASVAERTLTPADRTAGPEKTTETSQVNVRTDACSPADPGRVDDAGAPAPQGGAPRTRGQPDCPNRADVDGPSSGLPAANVGTAMADRPANRPSRNQRARTSAGSTALVGSV